MNGKYDTCISIAPACVVEGTMVVHFRVGQAWIEQEYARRAEMAAWIAHIYDEPRWFDTHGYTAVAWAIKQLSTPPLYASVFGTADTLVARPVTLLAPRAVPVLRV
jgi:hypothetical protein